MNWKLENRKTWNASKIILGWSRGKDVIEIWRKIRLKLDQIYADAKEMKLAIDRIELRWSIHSKDNGGR